MRESLFITIFQLYNDASSKFSSIQKEILLKCILVKNTETTFLILYLLPNDDEHRQTKSSINGVFNEQLYFPVKNKSFFSLQSSKECFNIFLS